MTREELDALTEQLTGAVNESEIMGKEAGHLLVTGVSAFMNAETGQARAVIQTTYSNKEWNHANGKATRGKGKPKTSARKAHPEVAFPPEAEDLKYEIAEK